MTLRHRIVALSTATALTGAFAILPATAASAAPTKAPASLSAAKPAPSAMTLPVQGTDQLGRAFQGQITSLSTSTQNGKLMASGIMRTTDPATGQTVDAPFTTQITDITGSTRGASQSTSALAPAVAIPSGCNVLNLQLAPIQLNLLGLVVTIPNPVVVDITAVPGAGNLLGNLLCSVTHLLDQGGGLSNLLNGLLGAVSNLLNNLLGRLGL